MTTLDEVAELARSDQGLAVVATLRADGAIQSSVVNAGVMRHPLADRSVEVFVTYGKVKLANLRERPQLSVTFRAGLALGGGRGRRTDHRAGRSGSRRRRRAAAGAAARGFRQCRWRPRRLG